MDQENQTHKSQSPDHPSSGSQFKNRSQLKLLNQLTTRLQSLMPVDNFYEEIIRIITEHLNVYAMQLWSVDEDSVATMRAQTGAYQSHLKIGDQLAPSHGGITSRVIKEKKSVLCEDTSKDPDFTTLSFPVHSKSQLCIPVVKDGKVLATVNVESDQINGFDVEDVITMEAVAAQIAVVLSNRNLYKEVKDFNHRLKRAVQDKTLELQKAHSQIVEQQRLLQKENTALKTIVNKDNKAMDIVGDSPAIMNLLTMVDKIAPTLATVLIQGESGTGKELIARRLHYRSDREKGPYVIVNCGALQESLLESELFGHEKGAFTGAISQKIGLVETADGGTLFLDEIGELSLGIQTKLLRFLQEGEFYRIGGKKSLKVNVRTISATNRDLENEVNDGRFREDLFYRLNTITLRVPPLRKRVEDIGTLFHFFLQNNRFGSASRNIRVDPKVIEAFKGYDWPGNIRELQNTVERLTILADNNEIKLDDVPFNIRMPKQKKVGIDLSANLPLEDIERAHILSALEFNQGNKTKTAQSLGITIKTLYNKLHRYGFISKGNEEKSPTGAASRQSDNVTPSGVV